MALWKRKLAADGFRGVRWDKDLNVLLRNKVEAGRRVIGCLSNVTKNEAQGKLN